MNDIMIINSLFIYMGFWGLGVLLLWIRPRIEIFWKLTATIIFALHLWFFRLEIFEGFEIFKGAWYSFTIGFFKEFLALVFVNMFFFWPLALIIIFYKSDDFGAERLVKFLCLLSIFLWILFILYTFFSQGIDAFFYENLKEMIPGAG